MDNHSTLSENANKLLRHMEEGYGVTEFMLEEKWIQEALNELKPSGLIEYRRPLGWFIKDDEVG